jgi:hypothetical protein
VHNISATNDVGSSLVPCTLPSSSTASAWRALDPQPHGQANNRRHNSSASPIATSSSNAASPSLSIIRSVETPVDEDPGRRRTVQQQLRRSIVSLGA